MVEFTLGKNIKTQKDKFLAVTNIKQAIDVLNETESCLYSALKKITIEDKIKVYDLGDYKYYIALIKQNMNPVEWQNFGGSAWHKIKNCREVKVSLANAKPDDIYNFSLGIELASYSFDKYFTQKPDSYFPKLEKIIHTGSKLKDFSGYKPYASLANAVRYARDLINEPGNEMTPEIMAADIKRLEYLGLEVDILDEKQMQQKGFNLALAVAQGSVNKPRIAIIKWKGNTQENSFSVGLVGKGVTFDSGGISLKPATNMGDMKQDMTGSAVVVATMKSLALQQVKQNVVAVVGLVENMPSGSAYRPGDVIKSMSGITVEVVNTDAEGRLVLADCLTYIQQTYKPKSVIDIATLTGAIVVALGSAYAGLFSNNKVLGTSLQKAGDNCGEFLWHMPLHKDYDKQIESSIADIKNSAGRPAGSATAASFLKRFIEKDTKWAHLDVAGLDLSDGSKVLYPKGASAFGVRLLNKYINSL